MECSTRAVPRAPGELWILFERDDAARQRGGESGFVSGTGADNQRRVGALDRRCLQQPRRYHRLHQITASAERQILVDIGDRPEMLGDEELAPDLWRRRRARAASVTLLGRSWLSIMWMRAASNSVIASKPADQLPVLYRCWWSRAIGRSQSRSARQPLDRLVCSEPAKAAARRSTPTAGGASPVRFRRAARARIDAGGAAGAAGQAKWYRSLGPDNRGDRDRGRAPHWAHRAAGRIVPRPAAASRAGLGAGRAVANDATALTNQGWSERGTGSVRYQAERAAIWIPSASSAKQGGWRSVSRGGPELRALARLPPMPIRITRRPLHAASRRLTRDARCKTFGLHYRIRWGI